VSGKRLLDAVVSTLALVALLPAFLLVAAAIWLEDRGPVIFKQKRLGRNGRIFYVYKFRKLLHRPTESVPIIMKKDDELYSAVGKILDKTKLNELPQLVNVLKGEMSVVGPRPEIPQFSHCFVGPYKELLSYNPGIFGPSQSAFRNEAALYPPGGDMKRFYEQVLFPRKAELDLDYYRRATIASDLYWIMRSLLAVVGVERPDKGRPMSQLP
jgi:lipopolysaccharide/colanic/teichoic acid biosynthesis glycosyltransferase